jgi:hypothetical protein
MSLIMHGSHQYILSCMCKSCEFGLYKNHFLNLNFGGSFKLFYMTIVYNYLFEI